ncbi:ABC transporter substrate-binding protein [Cellulosilyticum sp. I15G10I2]|uniref:ABC transporter substrate-binding protein n=1 Tax=Cellulosilyticum sp. I15G10I2 TaxID=1892843 RepID=UPI001A9A5C74|nr:ABC transporter substrate-binding protein [Cellulosilyticum sp. I15G10I2]
MRKILHMQRIIFLMLGCGGLLMLSGCQGENSRLDQQLKDERTVVLGFAQVGAESSWRLSNTQSIKEAASAEGMQLMYINAEQKQDNQIKAIRSFIAYQVDAILLSPVIETGWENVLNEAKLADIPVILTDREIKTEQPDLYRCFVGSDFHKEGKMAGEFLKKKFKGYKEEINIVELYGTIGSSPAEGRSRGFKEVIKENPNFRVICSRSGDFMHSKGKEIMKDILDEYQDIDVLYSHNDSMTLGAIEAMEEVGIRPGKDIIIITIDGEQKIIDALKQGKVNCVIECNPKLGDTIVDLTKRLLKGENIPRTVFVEDMVFTEWDDLSLIAPRGY